MLVACTTSTEPDYASTGDVLALIFGTSATAARTDAQLANVSRLIRRASRWADGFVGYSLAQQVYSETLAGYGGPRIMFSVRAPVRAVLRLFDATSTGEATEMCSTDYVVESYEAGILRRDGGWEWTAPRVDGSTPFNLGLVGAWRPGEERRPWLGEYLAGYVVTGTTSTALGVSTEHENYTTGATLPEDVAGAVATRAAELFTNPLNVQSRSVGDLSVTYGYTSRGSGNRASEDLLAPYVRSA